MQRSPLLVVGVIAIAILTGCSASAGDSADAGGSPPSHTPTSAATESVDSAAEDQARAWLDATTLPPGAVTVETNPGGFHSYQGWPCQPVVQLEGFWSVPDTTVASAVNWLKANPTADLIGTTGGPPMPENPDIDEATVGYSPADDSQQGVVYTVSKAGDDVVIRAEVAALTADATCPSLPPGTTLGKPGQG
ncbi:hypothetical protein [Microbacterium sp. UFMG61]|uniref:hypothetical protein n=1 Tax=Microbacterium sp. UFMG61 TaxID=2745935 RepID=UPI00189009A0|nr:hypothetical protein [Microbacterium sp. UFMG61]